MKARERSRLEVATLIDDFIDGRSSPWDWDDFIGVVKFEDERLRLVQLRCAKLPDEFPSTNSRHYCSDEGLSVLRTLAKDLRAES